MVVLGPWVGGPLFLKVEVRTNGSNGRATPRH